MYNTKSYRVNSWSHWNLILITGFLDSFSKIYFLEDEQNTLWLFKEPFDQGYPLTGHNELSGKVIISELATAEKNKMGVNIKIRRYINLFSTILIRFEEVSFAIDIMSEVDYEILDRHKSDNLRFFNWL